jgi:hypothetical protein
MAQSAATTTGMKAGTARSIQLAPYRPEHFEGVCSLYAEVFTAPAAKAFRARWKWSQEENLFPGQTRRWVLLAGDTVVGFLGTVPLLYRVNGREVVAHTPCDYMVQPDHRFHGIKLMRQCFKECPDCVSTDDIEATIKVTTWLGAENAGRMVRYARVVDSRVMRRGRLAGMPGPFWQPITLGLRAYQALHLAKTDGKYEVQSVQGFDSRFDRFDKRANAAVPVSLVRDSRFLNWRYRGASPHAKSEVATVSRPDGELAGYVVYYMSQGPSHNGYIMDLQADGDDAQQVSARLLAYAVEKLRKAGAWVVQHHQALTPHTPSDAALRSSGFVPRGRHELLVRLGDADMQSAASKSENWQYAYGDSEASHSVI